MQEQASPKSARSGDSRDGSGWRQEGRDLLRGLAGGAIVGMPLLYTMEMWWHGMALSEWHLLGLLGIMLVVNFVFSRFVGFRREYTTGEALMESVTSVGIGVVFSAFILWLVGELTPELAPGEALGKIVVESLAVSLGVSFANAQVGEKSRTGEGGEEGGPGERADATAPFVREGRRNDPAALQLRVDLKDAAVALLGATLFSLNIAATEEVIMIAARLEPLHQLAVLISSFALCYIILFASGFEEHEVFTPSVFQHPVAETALTCALSLAVSFVLLSMIGQREAMSHPSSAVAATIALGLPATIGGAAGRLVA